MKSVLQEISAVFRLAWSASLAFRQGIKINFLFFTHWEDLARNNKNRIEHSRYSPQELLLSSSCFQLHSFSRLLRRKLIAWYLARLQSNHLVDLLNFKLIYWRIVWSVWPAFELIAFSDYTTFVSTSFKRITPWVFYN